MPSSNSPSSLTQTQVVAKSTVFPDQPSILGDLKLSVLDLPMLSCHYIQKGLLFPLPSFPIQHSTLIPLLKASLSQTLSRFPPLAGRLTTYSDGHIHITCNDAGVDFIHASAPSLSTRDVLDPTDVPNCVRDLFPFDHTVSYTGHHNSILAVQVTELSDAVFIGCALNHAVTDGTSFWNFFNTFSELCRLSSSSSSPNENKKLTIAKQPDFSRSSVIISPAVLRFPEGGPNVTFSLTEPLRERIFSFSKEAIQNLKSRTNSKKWAEFQNDDALISAVEILGKHSNDPCEINNSNGARVTSIIENRFKNSNAKTTPEISSFQSLCALLWRSVTCARKLPSSKTTTFRMAVNCRHRLEPKLEAYYFGNAIQSIPTYATAGEVLSNDTRWCAEQLNKNVKAHDNDKVRGVVEDWERDPRVFALGNLDGATMTMGSSPRFPMYDNDFGWGKPLAIRSGRANKFDGKISAFPGREGAGSVDLEVVLAPETMALLETDSEFMQYVSS